MAQLNITLNQEEILTLLQEDSGNAFKKLLQESLNAVLQAESKEQLKAEPYERTDQRTDSRNGTRERSLCTRIGTILLAVPRHRNEPFRTMIFDNYSRSEAALISAMAEMVVNGVSTRRVSLVVEQLCGKSISKSSVSELCRDLDKSVLEFKNRPLQETYPLVIADATYFKVRVDHRVVSRALMIAIAFNEKGRREVIGFELYDHESKETWQDFFLHLRSRGLKDVKMITSDAHEGILYGISRVFPDTPWQRCQYHFVKNIIEKAPKKYQEGLRTELHALFQCADIQTAGKKRDAILDEYAEAAPQAMECLDLGFEGAMTVMLLPESMRRFVRTSNYLERLNRELKRRSTAIGVFPNEGSVIRLMGSLLLEYHDKCQETQRMINKSAFDQLGVVSGELVRTAREQAGILAA
jgi:transposase-like protein